MAIINYKLVINYKWLKKKLKKQNQFKKNFESEIIKEMLEMNFCVGYKL